MDEGFTITQCNTYPCIVPRCRGLRSAALLLCRACSDGVRRGNSGGLAPDADRGPNWLRAAFGFIVTTEILRTPEFPVTSRSPAAKVISAAECP